MTKYAVTLGCLVATLALWPSSRARAEGLSVGPHVGFNLDEGSLHLGVDLVAPLTRLTPSVTLSVWPSFAHVIVHEGHDVELLGVDFPFIFELDQTIVSPFVAPGLGLAFYGNTSVKFNLIGGAFFELDSPIRPFGAVAIRLVDGTFVDVMGGVLFEL